MTEEVKEPEVELKEGLTEEEFKILKKMFEGREERWKREMILNKKKRSIWKELKKLEELRKQKEVSK
jgi:DNA-binding response OmpR family regulator